IRGRCDDPKKTGWPGPTTQTRCALGLRLDAWASGNSKLSTEKLAARTSHPHSRKLGIAALFVIGASATSIAGACGFCNFHLDNSSQSRPASAGGKESHG